MIVLWFVRFNEFLVLVVLYKTITSIVSKLSFQIISNYNFSKSKIFSKSSKRKTNNEKRTKNYEFFNLVKVSIIIFKWNITKDSYDKDIDNF